MTVYLLIVALTVPTIFLICLTVFISALLRLQRTVDRMEEASKLVASALAATGRDLHVAADQRTAFGEALSRIEAGDAVVADNLASSVSRADATEGPEGAAADAALRTGDTAAAITKRQDDAR